MADAFQLVALALPGDVAPESLPAIVHQFVADCWPGMSRSQLIARARRFALRPSLRAYRPSAPGDIGHFALTLMVGAQTVSLIAHLRRVAQRRASARNRKAATASRPPARSASDVALLKGRRTRRPSSNSVPRTIRFAVGTGARHSCHRQACDPDRNASCCRFYLSDADSSQLRLDKERVRDNPVCLCP
ncbi:hypothetical protein HDG37_007561 [Paraburkholderia sp. MM5384-R2]|nr:hypothetical protein [Paraburkholderia sp. MM5384-R2]